MSNISVDVVSTSPVSADIRGTALIGDMQLDLFLDTGSRTFDLRASDPVEPVDLVGALGLGAPVGGLAVEESRFSGSLKTGSFRASLLLKDGHSDPFGAKDLGWTLSGVELELGRIGGTPPSGYAAFSATATLGSASGVVTGRYDDGAWAFTIEANDVGSEIFGAGRPRMGRKDEDAGTI